MRIIMEYSCFSMTQSLHCCRIGSIMALGRYVVDGPMSILVLFEVRHFRDWLLLAVRDPDRLAASSLERYFDYLCGPIGQPSLFEHQVRHYDSKHAMEVADRLHELARMPVKLIWGAGDAWQVVDWAPQACTRPYRDPS
jgi:hypothetical protein